MMQRRAIVAAMLLAAGGSAAHTKMRQPVRCDSGDSGISLRTAVGAVAAALGGAAALAYAAKRRADTERDERINPWLDRWNRGQTSWHLQEVHPQLLKHGGRMLEDGISAPYFPKKILVTLCGKTVDMPFLAAQGHQVVGVDAAPQSLEQLIQGHAVAPTQVSRVGHFSITSIPVKGPQNSQGLIRFVLGDFFEFNKEVAGSFEACFDRGGLVAIRPQDREKYVETLTGVLSKGARILLVTTEHDPFKGGVLGPPHSVTEADVRRLFGTGYSVEMLEREERMSKEQVWRDRGSTYFNEVTYLITKKF